MTIKEMIDSSIEKIVEFGKEERAAYELVRDVLKIEVYEMYDQMNEALEDDIIDEIQKRVDKYLHDIPLQHILGYETFYGRDIIVNEHVLIPRQETEELVENILYNIDDYFEKYEEIKVADIGSGSGAIAITLDLEEVRTKVYGVDISSDAVITACDNNDKHNADVTFYTGDLLEPLIKNNIIVDVLVSNPPYIPNQQPLESVVVDHEPHIALFGGEDGADFYRRILKDAHKVIGHRALIAFEIGYDQKQLLEKEVIKYFPNAYYEFLNDLRGKNRMLLIYHGITLKNE